MSKKPGVAIADTALTITPGNVFNNNPTFWAVNPSHRVEKENCNPPERDKFKTTLTTSVITPSLLATTRAPRTITLMRADTNF